MPIHGFFYIKIKMEALLGGLGGKEGRRIGVLIFQHLKVGTVSAHMQKKMFNIDTKIKKN